MNTEIIKKLKEIKSHLHDRYRVSKLGVFGSCARDGDTPGSDIDILVEFSAAPDLFEFFEVEEYLEKKLQRKVDLVRERALKRQIKENVMSEVIYL